MIEQGMLRVAIQGGVERALRMRIHVIQLQGLALHQGVGFSNGLGFDSMIHGFLV